MNTPDAHMKKKKKATNSIMDKLEKTPLGYQLLIPEPREELNNYTSVPLKQDVKSN